MEETRASSRKQTSILLDEDDWTEVERIARAKRSNISQVCRELIVEGIERQRRRELVEAAV